MTNNINNNFIAPSLYFNPQPVSLHTLIDNGAALDEISKVCSANTIDEVVDGKTPLIHALNNKQFDVARILIESGANIHVTDSKTSETALHLACTSGATSIAGLLLEKNADVNAKTAQGFFPLGLAVGKNDYALIDALIHAGAKTDDMNGLNQMTALHIACQYSNVESVKRLLQAKADANAKSKDGFPPLHYAAAIDSVEIIELLLKHDAKIDEVHTPSNGTALQYACKLGKTKAVQVLLKANASPHIKTTSGFLPLCMASCLPDRVDIIKLLLAAGAKIDAENGDYRWTALFDACNNEIVENIIELLQAGADPFFEDTARCTCLDDIVELKQKKCIAPFFQQQLKDLQATNPDYFKVLSRQQSYIAKLEDSEFYHPFWETTFESCLSILNSNQFSNHVDKEFARLRELKDRMDPSFLVSADDLLKPLRKIRSLYAKIFSPPLNELLAKKHLHIAEIEDLKEHYRSSLSSKSSVSFDAKEKEFEETDSFALLASFEAGIAQYDQRDKQCIYSPKDSYRIIFNIEDDSSIYKCGLLEGKDLKALGLDFSIPNYIDCIENEKDAKQKQLLWGRLEKCIQDKILLVHRLSTIPKLKEICTEMSKELDGLSQMIKVQIVNQSGNDKALFLKLMQDDAKVISELHRVHKLLSIQLLKAYFSQGEDKLYKLLSNAQNQLENTNPHKASEEKYLQLSELMEKHPHLTTIDLYRLDSIDIEKRGKKNVQGNPDVENSKSKKMKD